MNYRQKRYRYVNSLEEMQLIYKISSENAQYTYFGDTDYDPEKNLGLKYFTWIKDTDRYYSITTSKVLEVEDKQGNISYQPSEKNWNCTYIFDKTGKHAYDIHPSVVAKLASKYYKPVDISDCFEKDKDGKIINSAKPILGFNPAFDKTEHQVVVYDLNSAYAEALTKQIIDTNKMEMSRVVNQGEVGFILDANLTMMEPGHYADFVFPLIDSPYKEFAIKWYNEKKLAPKGSKQRNLAKNVLVITVGLMQRKNPFLRAYIVNSCNRKIEYFVNKYKDKVCTWNTDAVYCTEHIPELDALCGNDIGQFKVEYEGLFRQVGLNYQKVDEEVESVSYRGIIKSTFSKDFNLLEDNIPATILPYKANKEGMLIKNEEFKI